MPRKLRVSEDQTRKQMIDPQLEQAGWYLRDHSKVKIEIPVDGYDAEPWNGVSDYTLYRENGEVLAVVEAKKTTVDVRLAEAQLTHYVTEIEKHQSFRPFGFLANGLEIHFVDVEHAPKREVFGFFTREDLENLLFIRQNAKFLSAISPGETFLVLKEKDEMVYGEYRTRRLVLEKWDGVEEGGK
jgi:type I site-specific restriction endonuclease